MARTPLADIPGYVADWSSDSLTEGDGVAVTQWSSLVNGSNVYASQSSASLRPIRRASVTPSGKSALEFDGVGMGLTVSAAVKALTNNVGSVSMFVVSRPRAVGGSSLSNTTRHTIHVSRGGSSVQNRFALSYAGPTSNNPNAYRIAGRRLDSDSNHSLFSANEAYPQNSFHISTGQIVYENNDAYLNHNGTNLIENLNFFASGAGNTSSTDSQDGHIGSRADNAQERWMGDIARVVLFINTGAPLTTEQKNIVRSHLADWSGVTLAEGYVDDDPNVTTNRWDSATQVNISTYDPLWLNTDGTWNLEANTGWLEAHSVTASSFAVRNENLGANHFIESRVVGHEVANTNDANALVVGSTPAAFGAAGSLGSSRHLECWVRRANNTVAIEEKTASGSWTLLGSATLTAPAYPYTMRAELSGGKVTLYVNGTAVLGPLTPSITLGQSVGLRTYRIGARHDETSFGSLSAGTTIPSASYSGSYSYVGSAIGNGAEYAFFEDFNTGTVGATVTASETSYDTFGGAAPKYVSSFLEGVAIQFDGSAGFGQIRNFLSTMQTQRTISRYLYFDDGTHTTTNSILIRARDYVTSTNRADVVLRTDNTIGIRDGTVLQTTTTHVIEPFRVYRFVWKLDGSSQTLEIRDGANNSLLDSISGAMLTGGFDGILEGFINSPSGTIKVAWDYSADKFGVRTIDPYVSPVIPTASHTGSYSYAGSATAKSTPKASLAGSYSYAGSATAKSTPKASLVGSYSYVGSATAKSTPKASLVGSYSYVGSATAKSTPKASLESSYSYAGIYELTNVPKASYVGTYSYTSSAVGKSAPKSSLAGSYSYIGVYSLGNTPKASLDGAYSYVGSAAAKRMPKASVSGSHSWSTIAVGKRAPKTTVFSQYSWIAEALGKREPKAETSGGYDYVGTAIGLSGLIVIRDVRVEAAGPYARNLSSYGPLSRLLTSTGPRS